jgi:hypothetical protein
MFDPQCSCSCSSSSCFYCKGVSLLSGLVCFVSILKHRLVDKSKFRRPAAMGTLLPFRGCLVPCLLHACCLTYLQETVRRVDFVRTLATCTGKARTNRQLHPLVGITRTARVGKGSILPRTIASRCMQSKKNAPTDNEQATK